MDGHSLMRRGWMLVVLLLGLGAAVLLWHHPRIVYYRSLLWARVYYRLHPPQKQLFLPTLTVAPPSPTAVPATPVPTFAQPTPTVPHAVLIPPTPTPTPLPLEVRLPMVRHEYQKWNNCAPANLSMALAYWGWQGDQDTVARWTKPNPRDKNVSPAELARFVEEKVPNMGLIWRPAGTLDLLKAFLAAGFPVLVEKGFYVPQVEGWMGHYLTLYGYDETRDIFLVMDSYLGPNRKVPYDALLQRWRDFNYIFLVPYPKTQEQRVLEHMGAWQNMPQAWERALYRAQQEADALSGLEGFFAQFNVGEALTYLGRYQEASQAFDRAFLRYAALPEPERPWRVLWYHEAPFIAYYHAGRYQDVIRLANTALEAMSEPVLEEVYFWRGMAEAALGETKKARQDLKRALNLNPRLDAARQALHTLETQGGAPTP